LQVNCDIPDSVINKNNNTLNLSAVANQEQIIIGPVVRYGEKDL